MKFSKELTQEILDGATVVFYRESEILSVVLIRLPKDRFERSDDGAQVIEFEYKQYEVHHKDEILPKMFHSVSRNGTKREVIKRAKESYYETRADINMAIKMKEKRGK